MNGKITWTFNETYFDPIANATKPYKMQADIAVLGAGAALDEINLAGIVLSGVNAGATATGSVWFNPADKSVSPSLGTYNTKYTVNPLGAAGCADGTPNNASLTYIMEGGGDAATPSGLGTVAQGLHFDVGQP